MPFPGKRAIKVTENEEDSMKGSFEKKIRSCSQIHDQIHFSWPEVNSQSEVVPD